MIKLKITHSGRTQVKCKIPPEIAISDYEIALIKSAKINGLMQIENTGTELVFGCEEYISMPLSQWVNQMGKRVEVKKVISQVCNLVREAQDKGLNICKICFHPAYAFVASLEFRIYFCYFPLNGFGYTYDPLLFLKDLLQKEDTQKNDWAKEVLQFNDITELMAWNRGIQADEPKSHHTEEELLTEVEEDLKTEVYEEEPLTISIWEETPIQRIDEDGRLATNICEEDPTIGTEGETDDEELPTTSIWEETPAVRRTEKTTLSLIRLNTQESAIVGKTPYLVGRSQQRADFCVSGNRKVGNVHAIIKEDNGGYYLEDNDSKNGIFVDGRKMECHEKVKIYDGFKFYLSDEGFQVKFRKEGRL